MQLQDVVRPSTVSIEDLCDPEAGSSPADPLRGLDPEMTCAPDKGDPPPVRRRRKPKTIGQNGSVPPKPAVEYTGPGAKPIDDRQEKVSTASSQVQCGQCGIERSHPR